MKVIITGATGMVGRGVLLECLDHTEITTVLCIGRSPVPVEHHKLKQLIHKDFSTFASVKDQLHGYDACYMNMGVSSVGLKEDQYSKLTHDFTLSLAEELIKINPQMTITYVSGEGTDATEKGRSMWARVKGKTENDLIKLGFAQAFMFRPGIIIPRRGIKSATRLYQFMYDYFMWLIKIVKFIAPNSVVDTTQVGLAMINATRNGYSKNIIRPHDMLELSRS